MDEERRALEKRVRAGDDPEARVRLARSLERDGQREAALDLLLDGRSHAVVRDALARFPSWSHEDADTGRTRCVDLPPLARAPRLRWAVPFSAGRSRVPLLATHSHVSAFGSVHDAETGAPLAHTVSPTPEEGPRAVCTERDVHDERCNFRRTVVEAQLHETARPRGETVSLGFGFGPLVVGDRIAWASEPDVFSVHEKGLGLRSLRSAGPSARIPEVRPVAADREGVLAQGLGQDSPLALCDWTGTFHWSWGGSRSRRFENRLVALTPRTVVTETTCLDRATGRPVYSFPATASVVAAARDVVFAFHDTSEPRYRAIDEEGPEYPPHVPRLVLTAWSAERWHIWSIPARSLPGPRVVALAAGARRLYGIAAEETGRHDPDDPVPLSTATLFCLEERPGKASA